MVVDDEADVIDMLVINLRAAGFQVITVEDGATALAKARNESPSLIILDLMLPQMPGLEICKVLKSDAATRHIPVIMLTAKAEEVDKIVGLELGADDYVTKPFSPRELILRINRSLRRGKEKVAGVEKMAIGDLVLDHTRHEVLVKGKPVELDRDGIPASGAAHGAARTRAGPRQPAQRCLGLRKRHRYAHGGYACAPPAREARPARHLHRDDPRRGLSHQRR